MLSISGLSNLGECHFASPWVSQERSLWDCHLLAACKTDLSNRTVSVCRYRGLWEDVLDLPPSPGITLCWCDRLKYYSAKLHSSHWQSGPLYASYPHWLWAWPLACFSEWNVSGCDSSRAFKWWLHCVVSLVITMRRAPLSLDPRISHMEQTQTQTEVASP